MEIPNFGMQTLEGAIPAPNQKPYCRFPRWESTDKMWICCHGGGACGSCSGYPKDCKPPSMKEYWRVRYEEQRKMESETHWRYCPWCGAQLAIYPPGHICGESDID